MRPDTATDEDLAPLVLELARALRARRVHPSGHPVVADSIRRAAAIWRVLGEGASELGFAARDAELTRTDGAALACVGAPELALELSPHGVRRLVLRGPAEVRDLELLVDTLAREPSELAAAGGAGAALKAAGALAIELVGSAPATAAPAPTPKSDAPAAPRNGCRPRRPRQRDPLAEKVAELVRLLGELESCDDFGGYNLIANKLEVCVDALVRSKRWLEGYRAALVFTRHASDREVRSEAMRREASDRLRRLSNNDELLDAIVEHACASTGLASVQASQVLVGIGVNAVGALLRHAAEARDPSRAQAAQILIAMGDAALAPVVDELRCETGERARRAARLLGEMQNPRAVESLVDALRSPDTGLGREAARALARIGNDAAVAALVAGLRLAPQVAETCAGCLGGLRHSSAARALGDLLDLEREVPDGLRREAMRGLGKLGGSEALARLKRVLDHAPLLSKARYRALRIAAAQAIAQIGGPAAIQALQPHANRGDADVRQACQEALRRVERAAGK